MSAYICGMCGHEFNNIKFLDEHTQLFHGIQTDQLLINGVSSTKMPSYNLIYKSGLISLANRCQLGQERKGNGAINAMNLERSKEVFKDDSFVRARMNNAINHIYNAINKLSGGPDDGEDDAGAIMFAGMVLAEYYEQKRKRELNSANKQNNS